MAELDNTRPQVGCSRKSGVRKSTSGKPARAMRRKHKRRRLYASRIRRKRGPSRYTDLPGVAFFSRRARALTSAEVRMKGCGSVAMLNAFT